MSLMDRQSAGVYFDLGGEPEESQLPQTKSPADDLKIFLKTN